MSWLNNDDSEVVKAREANKASEAPRANGYDPEPIDLSLLSASNWLARDIPEPDFLLGELLSTTSRIELIGPTGLGKTNLLLALAIAVADGRDFLHWRGYGRPRRVLYIDGEMSRRLAKKRLVDAARRNGGMPATLFYLNREDFPKLKPLNTKAGQHFVDVIIEALGGVDLLILDNVQSLLLGDMKDEEPWQHTLPWVRSLTSRNIGQIWAHHTGHDESRGYGSKTREWQLDSVILMEAVERSEVDIAFSLRFTKARERSPDNRADFDQVKITLANDTWTFERGDHVRTKKPVARDRAFELLKEQIVRHGVIPPASSYIPPDTRAVTIGQWRHACELGAFRPAMKRQSVRLLSEPPRSFSIKG